MKEGWGGRRASCQSPPHCGTLCVVTHIPASALYLGRIDPYGFERPHDYESYKDMMDEYVVILNRRSMRWSKLLQEKPQVEKNMTGTDSNQGTKSVLGAICCSVALRSFKKKNVFVK